MKLSTRGRYGIHAMYELAKGFGGAPMSIKAIAEKQDIPEAYLEQIIAILNKAGYIRSTRGAQGGYQLVKDPKEYTVGMILRLTEGSLAPVECLMQNAIPCEKNEKCATVEIYRRMYNAINDVIDNTTLQDLLDIAIDKEEEYGDDILGQCGDN